MIYNQDDERRSFSCSRRSDAFSRRFDLDDSNRALSAVRQRRDFKLRGVPNVAYVAHNLCRRAHNARGIGNCRLFRVC